MLPRKKSCIRKRHWRTKSSPRSPPAAGPKQRHKAAPAQALFPSLKGDKMSRQSEQDKGREDEEEEEVEEEEEIIELDDNGPVGTQVAEEVSLSAILQTRRPPQHSRFVDEESLDRLRSAGTMSPLLAHVRAKYSEFRGAPHSRAWPVGSCTPRGPPLPTRRISPLSPPSSSWTRQRCCTGSH